MTRLDGRGLEPDRPLAGSIDSRSLAKRSRSEGTHGSNLTRTSRSRPVGSADDVRLRAGSVSIQILLWTTIDFFIHRNPPAANSRADAYI
jgi:hypothetical protein